MAVVTTNLGPVTAYGDAVRGGYTGTKEQWEALMADYGTIGTQAQQDAQTASTAAQTATTKASEASASATQAQQAAASVSTPDTTLTQSGKAADAKATGDEISALKEDFTGMINSAYVTDSASGSVAHFTDGADNIPMKSVKVNIEPVQSGSGDPSPTNVRPISGWSSVNVTRAGKNLCNILDSAGVYNGITYTASNGVVTVDGTATANVYRGTVNIPLKAGTYTVTNIGGTDTADAYVLVSDTSTNPSSWITLANLSNGSPVTFTLDHDIVVAVRVAVINGTTVSNKVFKPMLVYGSDAPTEYEPYNGDTYDISLASAGTVYGGTLDVLTGKLTVYPYYASYNGETLTGEWISDRDVYAVGTNPTIGAQVVNIGAEGTEYQLDPHEIASLLGTNNIWADTGDTEVEYRADTKLYIDKRLGGVTYGHNQNH